MLSYANRILSLLVLLALVSGTAQPQHACAVATSPAHADHHSESQDHNAPPADECRMFAPCNLTAMPQLAADQLSPAAILISDTLPAPLGYHPPVLIRETPPPRA